MALNADIIQTIELAVKSNGPQVIADLQAKINALKGDLGTYNQALQGGAATLEEYTREVAKLVREMDLLQQQSYVARRALAGQTTSLVESQRALSGATQGAVAFSRGMEDLATGGWIGPLNNLPGMVRGVGQALGVAAPQIAIAETAVSLLGTAAYVAYLNWDRIKKLLDEGLSPRLIDDLKSLQGQLKELTEKEWKTRIDVQDMTLLKEKIDDATRAKAAYDAMGGPDKGTKARGDAFSEAVKEADRGKVEKAINAVMGPVIESAETAKARKNLADQDAYMASPQAAADASLTLGASTAVSLYRRQRMAGQLEAAAGADRQNRNTAIGNLLSRAGLGDEASRAEVERMFLENRGKFAAVGVGNQFGAAVVSASKGNFQTQQQRDENDRIQQQAAQKLKQQQAQVAHDAAAEGNRPLDEVKAGVQKVSEGFRDQLEAGFYEAMRAHVPEDKIKSDAKAGLQKAVEARGFNPGIASAIANTLIDKAFEEALNSVNSGTLPKLLKQDAAGQARGDRAALRERTKQIRQVDDNFLGPIEEAIARNRAAQAAGAMIVTNDADEAMAQATRTPYALPERTLSRRLGRDASRRLRATGQDPSLADDLVQQGFEEVGDKTTQALANVGTIQEALMAVVGQVAGRQDKLLQQQVGQMQRANMMRGQQVRGQNNLPSLLPQAMWNRP